VIGARRRAATPACRPGPPPRSPAPVMRRHHEHEHDAKPATCSPAITPYIASTRVRSTGDIAANDCRTSHLSAASWMRSERRRGKGMPAGGVCISLLLSGSGESHSVVTEAESRRRKLPWRPQKACGLLLCQGHQRRMRSASRGGGPAAPAP
jgi:hypothetical protein